MIPLPSRETRSTVPPPPSQAPRGRQAEPSDTVAQQDDPDFSPRHSRRSSRLEEREFQRERWRDEREPWRRRGEAERGRNRDDERRGQRNGDGATQARPGAASGAVADATPVWLDRACAADRDQRVTAYLSAIEQRTSPSAGQLAYFDTLKKAATSAGELLRAACDTPPALTPTRQVEVVEQRAKAVLSAIDVLKPALDAFYAALDDEQKARFNMLPAAAAEASARPSRPDAAAQPGGASRAYGDGQDFGPEGARSADEVYEPRRKTRRVRRYRYYYPW